MQNRYFCDIGDFGKYGMLRELIKSGIKLGINWYLFPDETHNGDGKHTQFLHNDRYGLSLCDLELYTFLQQSWNDIERGASRTVSKIEESKILGETQYFSKEISFPFHTDCKVRLSRRKAWHNESMEMLKSAQIVFYDPDNGLEVDSVGITSKKGGKYVQYEELKNQYKAGQSIIVYYHGPLWFKQGEIVPFVQKISNKIKEYIGNDSTVKCLKWETTSKRFYFWIMRPEHRAKLLGSFSVLSSGEWGKHFKEINV